ncbi:MAG: DUF6391 domain-containing protein [Chloroflexi bacterium]|nr:DUF6391 domain-containing protein [Chloroflexota bacterium]MCY3581761.1 DUF6391 domain-containing protein [Chloroflexota bacterium]MCY3714887.1 DUF6391 domain-containing protein [Chloroflexota bacterium]MDE2649187.1 DUF6391 domain-containing protein [Chloroflexota bacterium]MXV93243.1 hypothetical protein [Chloroflexota bacterium]
MSPIEQLAQRAAPLLRHPYILRIRRNHGLEHATIHILSRHGHRLSGRSDSDGFYLLGDVPSEQVESAVNEALERMAAGESELAVHPNCGTNLVTASFLATLVGFAGFAGQSRRQAWRRFNTAMTVMSLVLMIAPALGGELQRHVTTAGDTGGLQLKAVKRHSWQLPFNLGRLVLHRVATQQAQA